MIFKIMIHFWGSLTIRCRIIMGIQKGCLGSRVKGYGSLPKSGYSLGILFIRTIVFWGSILGCPYLGKLPYMYIYIFV